MLLRLDKPQIEHAVKDIQQESNMKDDVFVDTVHRFSGLDKSAVIGVNPYVNEEHANFQKFLLNLATRAKDKLVIITTSDNLKLSESLKSK
jgi:superfamily I DNA and/or RNA helicase